MHHNAPIMQNLDPADSPIYVRLALHDAGTYDSVTKTGGFDGSIVLNSKRSSGSAVVKCWEGSCAQAQAHAIEGVHALEEAHVLEGHAAGQLQSSFICQHFPAGSCLFITHVFACLGDANQVVKGSSIHKAATWQATRANVAEELSRPENKGLDEAVRKLKDVKAKVDEQ
eukprot:scaffold41714_cov21-Tisochrysis_lutea.AAC.1